MENGIIDFKITLDELVACTLFPFIQLPLTSQLTSTPCISLKSVWPSTLAISVLLDPIGIFSPYII